MSEIHATVSPSSDHSLPLIKSHSHSGLEASVHLPATLPRAILQLLADTVPTFLFYLSNMLVWTFNLYYAGKKNDANLTSSVGLTNTWMGATIFYIIFGLNIGTTATCSQALGAKEYTVAGFAYHRALISRLSIALLLYPLQFFSENIFTLFGYQQMVAQDAGTFCRYQIAVVILIIFYDTTKSMLMANGIYSPFIVIQSIGIVAHWFLLDLFVMKTAWGVLGFCVAMTGTYLIMLTLLIMYICIAKPCPEVFFFLKKESFKHIIHQLREEIPIGGILYLDFAAEQIAVMLAGTYPAEEFAAQILNYNVMSVMTLLPIGFSATLTTYVGCAAGENDLQKLSTYIKAGFIITLGFLVVEGPALYFLSEPLARIFSNDMSVIGATQTLERMYSFAMVADFTQLVMSAILRGIGKEHIACVIFLLGNYVVGLPAAFVLGTVLKKYSKGLLLGIISGMVVNAAATSFALWKTNLRRQAESIANRIDAKAKIGKFAGSYSSFKASFRTSFMKISQMKLSQMKTSQHRAPVAK